MDKAILDWVNGYVGQSEKFDIFVSFIADSPLVKGVPLAMVFLFLWFLPRENQVRTRQKLIALLAVSIVAIAVGRMAALLFPYRPRPLHTEGLNIQVPATITSDVLDGWSSFPSDHAVFFAALVTGFWIVNRWAGLVVALHALLVVGFARVYLTFHYPSDILGGAVIGVAVGLVLMWPVAGLVRRADILDMAEIWPQYFHPLLFIVLFQVSTMFNSGRQFAELLITLLS